MKRKKVNEMLRHLVVLVLFGFLFNGCALLVLPGMQLPNGPLQEEVVEPAEWGFLPPFPGKILVLDIQGSITDESTRALFANSDNTVEMVKEQLNKAAEDSAVKAVVLRINSPGGSVTASDIIYREIVKFKQETEKPVVACLMDVGASGGYYVALAADKIVAHPTTITGSVGVIAHLVNLEGLFDKIGVGSSTIKSGSMKDMGSPFRALSPEEQQVLQEIIDQMFERFVSVTKNNREEITEGDMATISSGQVFTARQALQLNMIDQIAYLSDAIELAMELSDTPKANVVLYRKPYSYKGNIYASSFFQPRGDVNLFKFEASGMDLLQRHPVFLYLWMP